MFALGVLWFQVSGANMYIYIPYIGLGIIIIHFGKPPVSNSAQLCTLGLGSQECRRILELLETRSNKRWPEAERSWCCFVVSHPGRNGMICPLFRWDHNLCSALWLRISNCSLWHWMSHAVVRLGNTEMCKQRISLDVLYAAHDEPWNRFQTFPECILKLYDMSTLFWRRSAELILRSWPLSWPTAWPSSTPWRLRPLEPCLVPAACQFWAAPQLQMRRFNTRRLGRFQVSGTPSERVRESEGLHHHEVICVIVIVM